MDGSTVEKGSSTPYFLKFVKDNFNKNYITSSIGIVKIGQMASMVTSFSALAHYKLLGSHAGVIFYIFLIGDVLICAANILVYTIFMLSLNYKMKKMVPQCFKIATMTFTASAVALLLILSSLLAVEADQVRNNSNQGSGQQCFKCSKINIAAVFGFLAAILFAVEAVQHIIHHKREQLDSKPEVTQTEVTEFNPRDL